MKNRNRLLYIGTFVTALIYIIWRTLFTLPLTYGIISLIAGLYLWIVEFLGMSESLNHYIGMSNPLVPQKPELKNLPSVDVLIPTYNEPVDLLRKTILGAKQLEYPDLDKVKIYLCDDGNRKEVFDLANELNINYLTRDENKHAKAGNLNNALKYAKGDLVAVFDADMIPLSHFLLETVPFFNEEKIGFIQTPQAFYNPDLFQYHLYSEQRIPDEQDYFYRDVQLSRNKSNTVIFGGSNTLISRKALDEVGGFRTGVITEDFATGILIQNKGYTCYAIDKVCAIGLAPNDVKSLFKQRERWARGCIQTVRNVNLIWLKGLSIGQKLSYLSSVWYWYEPIKRLIYILAPVLFSVFGIMVVRTTLIEVLLFWFPMYWFSNQTLRMLSKGIRTTKWTSIYNTILFPYLFIPVIVETLGIRKRKFSVTSKTRSSNTRFNLIWTLPHIILLILTVIGAYNMINRIFLENTLTYLVVLYWLLVNMYNLLMSIFFMLGRTPLRNSERFMAVHDINLKQDNLDLRVKTVDISEGGFSVSIDYPYYFEPKKDIEVQFILENKLIHMIAEIVNVRNEVNSWRYAFKYKAVPVETNDIYLQFLYNREPSLPTRLPDSISTFDDLRINLLKRVDRFYGQNRKLPRIHVNQTFNTTDGGSVHVHDFNYDYFMVHGSYGDDLSIYLNDRLVLVGKKFKQVNSSSILYQVDNREELIKNPYFNTVVNSWISKEVIIKSKSKKRGGFDDEFNEIEAI